MPTKITKIIKNENDSVVLSFKTTFNTPLHIILPTIIRFIAYGTDIHSNPYNRHIPVKGHVRGCHIFLSSPSPYYFRQHHYPNSCKCHHIVKERKKPSASC